MERYIDDHRLNIHENYVVEENKHGTVRVNGRTNYESLKEYKKQYGEKDYVEFLLKEKMQNPRGIKIKDPELAEKVKSAGLQL